MFIFKQKRSKISSIKLHLLTRLLLHIHDCPSSRIKLLFLLFLILILIATFSLSSCIFIYALTQCEERFSLHNHTGHVEAVRLPRMVAKPLMLGNLINVSRKKDLTTVFWVTTSCSLVVALLYKYLREKTASVFCRYHGGSMLLRT